MSDRVSGLSCLFNSLSRLSCLTVLAAALLASGPIGASAQPSPPPAPSPVPEAARANAGTLGVISGGADGTYIRIAADLANVLDGEDLRILPMIGRGSLQNLRDIMFLRGVDIGIVQMDAREQLQAEKLQDSAVRRLRYITRLYNEEVHIIASRDITDIRQLSGKKVNIDKAGSGTNLTSRLIFDKLGIKPELTTFDQASWNQARTHDLRSGFILCAAEIRRDPGRRLCRRTSSTGDCGISDGRALSSSLHSLRGRDRGKLFPGALREQ
jgi:uncharacterized protein